VPTVNANATALRFFFKVTLKRSDLADGVVSAREPRRLPVVLSPEEVGRLSPEPASAQAGGQHWIASRPRFLPAVPVLSRLFRRLFLERLTAAYQAGRLQFFANQAALAQPAAFKSHLAALRKVEWVVYVKRPFGGPGAVLAYLSCYTNRIAIANSRLVAFDGQRVTFKWKDYRATGDARYKLMTLDPTGQARGAESPRRVHPPVPDPRPA
jgi:Putative transposase